MVKRYATHDFDSVLGMYYAKARFYDAAERRFTAVDPILDASQYDISEYSNDPMLLVQYLYVKNNALIYIDPLGLVYSMYVLSNDYPHRTLASGTLNDTRYAYKRFFAIREVAAVLDKATNYSANVDYDKESNSATFSITNNGKVYRMVASIDAMDNGLWSIGNEYEVPINSTKIYFTFYNCIGNDKTYVRVPDLAKLLNVIIVLEDQSAKISPQRDSKTRVLGADAFAELKWRVGVSLGVGWDGSGKVSLLGSVSAGIGTAGAGVGAFYAVYNTPSLSNISGLSFEIGGSVDIPGATIGVAGFSFGIDKSYAISSESFSGTVYSLGYGIKVPFPVEGHFQVTATGNISDGLQKLLNIILGNDSSNKAGNYIYGAA